MQKYKIIKNLILPLTAIPIGFSACSGFKASKELSSSSTGVSAIEAFRKSVYDITSKNCVECHGGKQAPYHAHPDIQIAYGAAKTKVNWENISASTLVLKTQDKHCGKPVCQTDGTAMAKAISDWKVAEFRNSGGGGGGGVIGEASDSKLRLGTRFFISSKLGNVFGPTASAVTANLIDRDAGNFGGPCDRYMNDFTGVQNSGDCTNLADSQASVVGNATPARMAISLRSCRRIVQNDQAITFALNAATGNSATNRAPTDADLQSIYEQFYVGRTASANLISSLKNVHSKAGSPLDGWRFLLATLCSSPDWQIP